MATQCSSVAMNTFVMNLQNLPRLLFCVYWIVLAAPNRHNKERHHAYRVLFFINLMALD